MIILNHPKRFLFYCCRRGFGLGAFTLVEILLVVSLFAVTSIAIYQTFASGVKIWNYAAKSFPEEDVLLTFERITRDVHNAFYFSLFEFKGEPSDLRCTTLIITKADPRAGASDLYVTQIGRVRYFFDQAKKQVLRQQADYGQATKDRWQPTSVVARGIEQLSFKYLYRENNRLVERLRAQGVMPAMVRVDIAYQVDREVRRMTRFIDIPVSLSGL